ncbi:MAG: exonuclease SbcCD subunit D [Chloroherpetonaceae bacterium]
MKILHTADIHIGYSTHGKDDAEQGMNSRWIDFENCFKFMVDCALKEDIDLFLFCGDAYRDASPSPTEQRIFAKAIRPLLDKHIPIVMLVGNHDFPVSFGKASSINIFGELSSDVHLFEKPGVKDIDTKSGKIRIVGMPWANRSRLFAREEFAKLTTEELRDKMLEIYTGMIDLEATRLREEPLSYPAILAMHAHVDGAELTEGSEKRLVESRDVIVPLSQIARREFSYVALGHFHRHQDLNAGSEPPIVYSGSIERISFNELNQPKGFVLVEIDEKKRATYKHVQTPARNMVSIDVDVRFSDNPVEKVAEKIDETTFKDAIVRVRIKCKAEQKKELNFGKIRERLKEAFIVSEVKIESDEVKSDKGEIKLEYLTPDRILETYLDSREDLKSKKEALLKLAKVLEEESNT